MQVVVTHRDVLRYVQGQAGASGRPELRALGEVAHDADPRSLGKAFRATGLGRSRPTATLLGVGEYQMHSVEAPEVKADEVRAAMRWKLKEIIDYPVEEATYDILPIPQGGSGAGRKPSMYVVTSKNVLIRNCMQRFEEAGVPLSIIDVPETAQRNIAALFEQDGRGLAVLCIDESGALLTLTEGGELILAKRIDVTRDQLEQAGADTHDELFERILVNLQRTMDSFERQFSQIVVDRLLCSPEPRDTGIVAFLAANLGMRVETLDLRSVVSTAEGVELDFPTQARYFHLIGCAFRQELPKT